MSVRTNFTKSFRKVALSLFAGLLSFSGLAFAQFACPPDPVAPSPQVLQGWFRDAPERGFLWEIEKSGRKSWLFGTIHMGKAHWVGFGPKTLSRLRSADVIALEFAATEVTSMVEFQSQIAVLAKADQANPLPPRLQERLFQTAANNCVATDMIKALPLSLALLAAAMNGHRKDGFEPAFGIDNFVEGFARGAGKPIVALETITTQVRAIGELLRNDRDTAVTQMLDELDSGETRAQLKKFASVWESADHDALSSYQRWCNCVKTEREIKLIEQLNDARNPAMADGIDAIHSRGKSVFAAVGSLHFTGPKALQDLMARKGYVVRVVR